MASSAVAEQLNVSIGGFGDPTSFDITSQHLDLRVSEQVPAPGLTNTSTHILIEGLLPLEEGAPYYASTYSGVDINNNGAIQDTGVLYLTMPSGGDLPPGTVSSAIVGVVQRSGDWDDYNPVFPATDPSSSSGPGDYDGSTLSLNLSDGVDQYLGNTTYTVVDSDTLILEAFTLTKDGPTSYNMSQTTLMRDGNRFYGTLTNLNEAAAYDSLLFSIELSGIPDVDMDGIPDISDAEVSPTLEIGVWNLTSLGYVWGATSSVGYSTFMGWVSLASYPNVYHFETGWWLQVVSTPIAPDTAYWMSSPNPGIGWIYTHSNWGGNFYHHSGGWISNNFLNPNP